MKTNHRTKGRTAPSLVAGTGPSAALNFSMNTPTGTRGVDLGMSFPKEISGAIHILNFLSFITLYALIPRFATIFHYPKNRGLNVNDRK